MNNTWLIIFICLTVLCAATAFILAIRQKSPPQGEHIYPREGKNGPRNDPSYQKRNRVISITFGLSLVFLFIVVILSGNKPAVTDPSGSAPAGSATGEASPSNSPTPTIFATMTPPPQVTPVAAGQKYRFLDEIDPILTMPSNFFIGGWSGKKPFLIDKTEYKHGIGMLINERETEDETRIPYIDGTYRSDCRETFIEYALRFDYSSLTFTIGADCGDPSRFGDEATNGKAQVIIYDATMDKILFNTDWQNYKYAAKDIKINLENVDILRITFHSSGVGRKRIDKALRFAIVDPVLVLSDDAEN